MPKIKGSWLFFGMLLLAGGILLTYLAYFAYRDYFLSFIFPGGPIEIGGVILMLLLPLIGIFGGAVLMYVSIGNGSVQEKEASSELPQPPPPPTQTCPRCGKPLNFIQQYGRWYCYTCNEYQ